MQELIREYVPWDEEVFKDAEVCDENAWLVTVLGVLPAMAIALSVRFDATRNGAWYRGDDGFGVLPSTV